MKPPTKPAPKRYNSIVWVTIAALFAMFFVTVKILSQPESQVPAQQNATPATGQIENPVPPLSASPTSDNRERRLSAKETELKAKEAMLLKMEAEIKKRANDAHIGNHNPNANIVANNKNTEVKAEPAKVGHFDLASVVPQGIGKCVMTPQFEDSLQDRNKSLEARLAANCANLAEGLTNPYCFEMPPATYEILGEGAKFPKTTYCHHSTNPMRLHLRLASSKHLDLQLAELRTATHWGDRRNPRTINVTLSTQNPPRYVMFSTLDEKEFKPMNAALHEGTTLPIVASAPLSAKEAEAAAVDSSTILPFHFDFAVPEGSLFSPFNVNAMCYFNTVLWGEGESVATYPYASKPYSAKQLKLGFVAAVRDQTQLNLPELTVDGALDETQRTALIRGRVKDFATQDNSNAQLHVITSSCLGDVEAADSDSLPKALTLTHHFDDRHYTKGGHMIVMGTTWFARISEFLDGIGLPEKKATGIMVPMYNGVHPWVLLKRAPLDLAVRKTDSQTGASTVSTVKIAPKEINGTRVLPLRDIITFGCGTSDPYGHPESAVRVSHHLALFISPDNVQRNSHYAIARNINATCKVTAHSDLYLHTNAAATTLVEKMKTAAASRGVYDANFMDTFPGEAGSVGEMVIITYHRRVPAGDENGWWCLTGYANQLIIAQRRFYDHVHYTEEDVLFTRENFDFYCDFKDVARENGNRYINFLRWEANDTMASNIRTRTDDEFIAAGEDSIFHSHLPEKLQLSEITFGNEENRLKGVFGVYSQRKPDGTYKQRLVRSCHPPAPPTLDNEGRVVHGTFGDLRWNLHQFPDPMHDLIRSPVYDLAEVKKDQPTTTATLGSGPTSTKAVEPPHVMFPKTSLHNNSYSYECQMFGYADFPYWQKESIYSASYIVPDDTLDSMLPLPPWEREFNSLYRELSAHFESPYVLHYRGGIIPLTYEYTNNTHVKYVFAKAGGLQHMRGQRPKLAQKPYFDVLKDTQWHKTPFGKWYWE